MKTKAMLKIKVQSMRSTGKTFGEIQKMLDVKIPKSTLSNWCKNVLLPKSYQKRIEKLNYINLRKGKELAIKKSKAEKFNLIEHLKNNNNVLPQKIDKDIGKMLLAILY
ncbi:MAG: hypothetical protein Q8R26_02540 [bacterium]|nr:hypothetical protein [bacterium]